MKTPATSLLLCFFSAFLLIGCTHGFTPSSSLSSPRSKSLLAPESRSTTSLQSLAGLDLDHTSLLSSITTLTRSDAEALAGPFFGLSLFPYLLFLYFLNTPQNETPKGVTVGFATCLLFVFLTIPAAIGSEVLYGVGLADCDWLHGSAESLLTITNLVTVVAFRQAFRGKEVQSSSTTAAVVEPPLSVTSYQPMVNLVILLSGIAGLTALIPALFHPEVHTPYLNGFLDIPKDWMVGFGNHDEPSNALTVGCWIIHVSSLVEFLVAMGFAWRWADIVQNPKWKGLTWGLIPLHSSGITACTYHLFYNSIPFLVPLQAFLTCVGNTTAAFAAYRLAVSNGWEFEFPKSMDELLWNEEERLVSKPAQIPAVATSSTTSPSFIVESRQTEESPSLIGFEDLGDALASDTDYTFLIKLFVGCAIASYGIKYGELYFDFPFDSNLFLALGFIFIPSLLNAFKWYKRSIDPTFEGWF